MPGPLTHAACPQDGARLVLITSANGAGDTIRRYECPNADWFGPWFTGDETGEIHISQLPEVTRSSFFNGKVTAGGGGSVTQTGRDDTDNQAAVSTGLLTAVSRLYGWDSIGGNWDRLRVNAAGELVVTTAAGSPTGRDDTDNQAAVATGLGVNVVRNYIWDGVGSNWDRWTGGVTQSGAWTVAATQSGAWTVAVNNFPATQPVSGTVTADTELPAATALADADPNPTTSRVGSNLLVFNGTTWDRARGTIANGLLVDVSRVQGTVAVTQSTSPWVVSGTVTANQGGAWTVTADTELPAASALADADPNPTTSRVGANNLGFNGTTWDRLRSGGDNANGEATVTLGAALTKARNYIWNGTTWDRWTGAITVSGTLTTVGNQTPGDAVANVTDALDTRDFLEVWNGTTWDRVRSAGSIGAVQVGGPAASGVAVAGNPLLDGGRGSAAVPTAVADGQAVALWVNRNGRLLVHDDRASLSGVYYVSSGSSTLLAAADAATAGRFWLINPVGSTKLIALRRMVIQSGISGTLAVMLTSPLITMERMTFTGTASGATTATCKRDSTDPAETGSFRTASTGMTITAGNASYGYVAPAVLALLDTAVYAAPIGDNVYPEDERILLRAGEGLVWRQSTVGSTGDIRNFQIEVTWEEFTAVSNV